MTSKTGGISGLHAQFGTQNHDGDLNEQFGAAGIAQRVSNAGGKVTDQDAHDQSGDQAGFGAQAQSPRNTLLSQLSGVSSDVGVGAGGVAGDGDEEDHGEGAHEAAHVTLHQFDADSQQTGHKHIGSQQGLPAGHHALGSGLPGIDGAIDPHADFYHPAKEIQSSELAKAQDKDNAAKQQGYFVFIKG